MHQPASSPSAGASHCTAQVPRRAHGCGASNGPALRGAARLAALGIDRRDLLRPGSLGLPQLHRDRARPCHICTGTGLARATSAPGPGSLPTHLHRCHLHHDRAQAQLVSLPKVVVSPKLSRRCCAGRFAAHAVQIDHRRVLRLLPPPTSPSSMRACVRPVRVRVHACVSAHHQFSVAAPRSAAAVGHRAQDDDERSVPPSVWATGMAVSSALTVVVVTIWFGMKWWEVPDRPMCV